MEPISVNIAICDGQYDTLASSSEMPSLRHDATEDMPVEFTFGHLLGLKEMQKLTSELAETSRQQKTLTESIDRKTDAILARTAILEKDNAANRADLELLNTNRSNAKAIGRSILMGGTGLWVVIQFANMIATFFQHHK